MGIFERPKRMVKRPSNDLYVPHTSTKLHNDSMQFGKKTLWEDLNALKMSMMCIRVGTRLLKVQ